MTSEVERKLFSVPDAETTSVFLTRDQLEAQDLVYGHMADVFEQLMVPWSAEVYQRICVPNVETTLITSASQFSIMLTVVTKSVQQNTEKYANTWLASSRKMRKQKKFSQSQFGLALRARNIAAMFLSHYILMQWQRAAIFSIFLNIVEREVFADHARASLPPCYNSFSVCQDGYARRYDRSPKDVAIGQQVEEKLYYACFGRIMIWAAQLHAEMKTHLEKSNIDARILFAPIYLQLQNSGESMASILEFFMRLMYVSIVESIASALQRELATGHTSMTLPTEYADKYFNVTLALAQRLCITGGPPVKRARLASVDDDNDDDDVQEQLVKFSAQGPVPLCGDTDFSCDCLPHDRTLSSCLELAEFRLFFTILQQNHYCLFGGEVTARESSLCLWVVWLQNVEKLYAITLDNDREAKINQTSSLGSAEDRRRAAISLLTSTPKPAVFVGIMDALRQFIDRHVSLLLRETGFDLNRDHLVNRLHRHISLLCDFYSVANVAILHRHFIDEKQKK